MFEDTNPPLQRKQSLIGDINQFLQRKQSLVGDLNPFLQRKQSLYVGNNPPLQRMHSHSFDLCNVKPEFEELEPQKLIRKDSLHHVGEQVKEREVIYIPKEWVNPKLDAIKTRGSLMTAIHLSAESIKITENSVSMELIVNQDLKSTVNFNFFNDGIVRIYCQNPQLPAKFFFDKLEKPANLTPYDIKDKINLLKEGFEVILDDVEAKFRVSYQPYRVDLISTKNGKEEVLLEMNGNRSLQFDDNISADFTFHNHFLYGLAEHACDLLLEDTKDYLPYRFYNQDVPKYILGSKNAIYGTVPLIISRCKDSPTMVSLYWQNASDTYIDKHKVKTSTKTFWLSERGDLDCYLFISHNTAHHYKSFSNLFGNSPMPQYFSMGYHQSRWSYRNQADLLEVNEKFNEYEIPCDTITLDIDHTDSCRYFTWNKELFPDPELMQDVLDSDDRQLITIADCHIKVDENYSLFSEALKKGLFIRNNQDDIFVGVCWPGDSAYLDFLNEETRKFWASQYLYESYKFSRPNIWAWNDMNEPSVFEQPSNSMPIDNTQLFKLSDDSSQDVRIEHREVHNIYGFCQNKATWDGMIKRNKDQNIRPHILSRSIYAGSQKYTTVWTGDTAATWDYLRMTVPQLLTLSLCGFSNCGGDVGGFIGDPEPELAVRWYQLGSFMPYFRAHSETTGHRREPWLYDKKYLDIIKDYINERYRLLPYWYTCFEDHCRTGLPVLRPIWFDQEKVENIETMKEQVRFMIGEALLVVPVLQPGVNTINDSGKGLQGRWYNYFTNKEVCINDSFNVGLEHIGCFVKGGHIIPKFELTSYKKSTKTIKENDIFLYVALDENYQAKGRLYSDDGHTFNFKKGECSEIIMEFKENVLSWNTKEGSGDYIINNNITKVVMAGTENKLKKAYLLDSANNKHEIEIEDNREFIVLQFKADANENWKIVFE